MLNSLEVQGAVDALLEQVEQDGSFFPPFNVRINQAGDLLFVEVPIVGTIDDEVSENAVKHLQDDIVPAAFADSSAQVYVSGATAGSLDFTDQMLRTAPYVFGFVLGLAFLIPNPPKDTDGRREESGRGGEGATGEIAWVPFGVGRSADGLHRRTGASMGRLRELRCAGWRENTQQGTLGPGWRESAGIFGCPVGGSVADGAVRPGVEWLAAGPRRG